MTRTFELRLLDSTRLAPPARSAEAAAPPRFAEAASLIRRSPAFARASEATIEALSARVRIARYEIGTVLTRGMAPPRSHVFLIAEGLVEVFARLRKDRQMLCGLLEAPGVLGDDELYGSGAWTLTARAAKPTTAVLIPNDAFEEVVRTDLEVAA